MRYQAKPSPVPDHLKVHEHAIARRDLLWSGLLNALRTGNISLIRRFLSRANLVIGNIAEIKDDVEFLKALRKLLSTRIELRVLVPTVDNLIAYHQAENKYADQNQGTSQTRSE